MSILFYTSLQADVVCALPDIEPDGSLGLQCKWKQNNDHGLENAAVGYLLTVRNGSKKHNTEVKSVYSIDSSSLFLYYHARWCVC
jgi:hypothetical protein